MSFLGFSATGIRSTFISRTELSSLESSLSDAISRHLPIVVYKPYKSRYNKRGLFELFLSSPEDVLPIIVLSHYIAERVLMPCVVHYSENLTPLEVIPDHLIEKLTNTLVKDSDNTINSH